MAETLEQAQERAEFYARQTRGAEALLGYLHGLACGTTEFKVTRDGDGADDGWTVLVDDGNGDRIVGRYYPGSNVHELVEWIEANREEPDDEGEPEERDG